MASTLQLSRGTELCQVVQGSGVGDLAGLHRPGLPSRPAEACGHLSLQDRPEGLAQAFIIGEDFIGDNNVCLVLGDNFFYGQGFTPRLREAAGRSSGATVFGYKVRNPERFGVVELDCRFRAISIEEKPLSPSLFSGFFSGRIFSSVFAKEVVVRKWL